MIVVNSIQSMYDGGYTLAGYCPKCERWGKVDLLAMIRCGRGNELTVGRGARCKQCGGRGTWQLRVPAFRNEVAGRNYV